MADRGCSWQVQSPLRAMVCAAAGLLILAPAEAALAQYPLQPSSNALPGPPDLQAPADPQVRQLVVGVQILGNSDTKDFDVQKHIH
ncbi:MAG TPA: hypothetical protein VFV87_22345, partial [Pirellulaceae bacterium]|nr:hypothetical protein [Pirellulaceae bacterium]